MNVSPQDRQLVFRPIATCVAAVLLTSVGCSSSSNDDSPGLRLATVAVDSDNDGMANSVFSWVFDPEGRSIAEEFDENDDGSIETRFARIREGNTLRIERDEGVDGTVEGESIWTVDDDGLLSSFTNFSNDGVAIELVTFAVNSGRVISSDVDQGADGTIDVTERYNYDASGLIAGAEFDFDGDGIADDTLNVVRQDNGTTVRLEEDYGNDGGIDYVRTLTYEQGSCEADDIANVATPVVDVCL